VSGRLQAVLALCLAVGLHLAAFALRPGAAGAASSGAGGLDLLTLQAADPAIAGLVAEWDRPPVPVAEPSLPDAPEAPLLSEAPDLPAPEAAPPVPLAPSALAVPEVAEAAPNLDVSPAAPPPPEVLPEAAREPAPKRPEQKQAAEPPKPAKTTEAKPAGSPKAAGAPKAAPGQKASRAAGSGGGDTAAAGKPSQAQTANLAKQWGAAIQARIERRLRQYPGVGRVTIQVTVARSGQVLGIRLVASSGKPALDEAALRAARAAGRMPAAPKGLTEDSHSFNLRLRFTR
jgi:protein TonB